MGINSLANQSVLAAFFYKIFCAKPEKPDIDLHQWVEYQIIDIVLVDKYQT